MAGHGQIAQRLLEFTGNRGGAKFPVVPRCVFGLKIKEFMPDGFDENGRKGDNIVCSFLDQDTTGEFSSHQQGLYKKTAVYEESRAMASRSSSRLCALPAPTLLPR